MGLYLLILHPLDDFELVIVISQILYGSMSLTKFLVFRKRKAPGQRGVYPIEVGLLLELDPQ